MKTTNLFNTNLNAQEFFINSIKLTGREIDIISCIINFKKAANIAHILDISPRTAETHIRNIMLKLSCNSKSAIFDLVKKSGDFDLLNNHYLKLQTKSAFERQLKKIPRQLGKKLYFFCKYDLETKENIDLFKKHLVMLGFKTAGSVASIDEFVRKTSQKTYADAGGNYLIYFIPQSPTNEELDSMTKQYSAEENIIFLLDKRCMPIGFKEGPPKNLVLINLTEAQNYYSDFFKLAKQLVPNMNFDKHIADFESLVSDITGHNSKQPKEVVLTEIKEYIAQFIENKVKSFIKQRKMESFILAALVAFAMVTGATWLMNNKTTAKANEVQQTAGNIMNTGKKDTNKNTEIINYLPFEPNRYFTGRAKELKEIEEKLNKYRLAILHSFSGTGKTTLAAQYANYQKDAGKVVRWINADSIDKVIAGYLHLGRELGIDYSSGQYNNKDKEELLREVLVKLQQLQTNILFILDNVESYQDIKAAVIDAPQNVHILITTRSHKLNDNADRHIGLVPFTEKEAREYLRKSLSDKNIDEDDINELIRNYGTNGCFLPLKLAQAATIINKNNRLTVKEYIKNIRKYDKDDAETYFLLEIWDKSPVSWQVLQYAAYLDPDFISFEIFDQLLGTKLLEQDIEYLKSQLLIEVLYLNNKVGFRIHRLIQDSFKKYIKHNPKSTINEQKIIDSLLVSLDELFPRLYNNPDENWQKAETLLPHVLKIIAYGQNKLPKHMASIYNKLGYYNFNITYQLQKALEYFRQALTINQALYKDKPHANIANSFYNIGRAFNRLGSYKQSLEYNELSLKMRKQLYNTPHPDIANSMDSIGWDYDKLGDYQKALKYFKQALEIKKQLYQGDHPDIAVSLSNLGWIYERLGDYKQSMSYHEQALKMQQHVYSDNHPDIANSLHNIGWACERLGDYKKALEYYEQALKMQRQLYSGNHPDIIRSISNIGWICYRSGDYNKALEYHKQTLHMYQQLYGATHPNIASVLHDIAFAYEGLGDYENAVEYNLQGLVLRQKLYDPNHPLIAFSFNNVGDAYNRVGKYSEALEYYKQSLEIKRLQYPDKHPDVVSSLRGIGDTYYGLNDYLQALKYHQQVLQIEQDLYGENNHPDIADIFYSLAKDYAAFGDNTKEQELLARSYLIHNRFLGENHHKTHEIRQLIKKPSLVLFHNGEPRLFIKIKSCEDDTTLKIKEKIQKKILNKIQKLANQGHWSRQLVFFGDTGIQGYLDTFYLMEQLGSLATKEAMEIAKMLVFEAINLGIMHSKDKDLTCTKKFIYTYPELMDKILKQHPEYFVDETILKLYLDLQGNKVQM